MVFIVIFILITIDLVYWQVIDAGALNAQPQNASRQFDIAHHVLRGKIFDRNGVLLVGRYTQSNGYTYPYFTDPSLAQTIGYDSDQFGKSGLQASLDSYLSGKSTGTDWSQTFNSWIHRPVKGDNVYLTIDENIQKAADDAVASVTSQPAAVVVSDPRTGEILAMDSRPYFHPGRLNGTNANDTAAYWRQITQNDPNAPLINRVTNGLYAPGSTFKVLTLSAALDTGVESLSTQFNGQDATGPYTVQGHTFDTGNNLPPGVTSVDLLHAFMYSDNIVFAHVGVKLGKGTFLDYATRFGLGQNIPFDLPVSTSVAVTPGENFDQVALASSAFGQANDQVTPMQMLLVTETIADGGRTPKPILVKSIVAPNGSTVTRSNPGTLWNPISSSTASQVNHAMVQVVAAGSGVNAQVPGVTVAGKTGTAQAGTGNSHSWFVAFAPADHPRVAVTVIVEHGGEGFSVAAPIAGRILSAALPLVH
jgi:peptidoglycan glycosyltransferase